MDDLHANVSTLEDSDVGNNLEQLSSPNEQHVCSASEVKSVLELGDVLHGLLQVKDDNSGSDLPSDDSNSSLEDESIAEDSAMATSSKCLQKCATFPIAVGAEENTPELQSENSSFSRSLSLPTAHKLVSAMKGSREKEGVPPRKLNVSWAPDVYDPPPTSLSHHPKKKTQKEFKSNKKHGKGKQKGKNMRGGGSGPKDKKHYRKIGGKSDRCLDSFADTDRVMSSNSYQSSLELLDFEEEDDIGGPESNCGSSYLGKAGDRALRVF